MKSLPVHDYLTDYMATVGLDIEDIDGPLGSPERLLRLVLDDAAKMPLDKVVDVAAMLKCDDRALFRMALAQFYSADTVALMERMFGPQERCDGEEAWVSFVRSVAPDDVQPPDRFAYNMMRTLLKRAALGNVVE